MTEWLVGWLYHDRMHRDGRNRQRNADVHVKMTFKLVHLDTLSLVCLLSAVSRHTESGLNMYYLLAAVTTIDKY